VANMLFTGATPLGYYLLPADIEKVEVYEYIGPRLSAIVHDERMVLDMHEMNARMAKEIEAREESQSRLREALAQVERLSIEDELTRLRNRRGFLTLAEQQIKLLRREGRPFLVMYADLDGLKRINDTYGHKEGDLAIRSTAQVLQQALRDSDIIARLGGDEFTALIAGAGAENVEVIQRRIESCCAEANRALHRPWKLSMSMGFFLASEGEGQDLEWMMARADDELYKRKLEKRGQPPTRA
jgi:diguanylate cyclase (GGDEF)-like protein